MTFQYGACLLELNASDDIVERAIDHCEYAALRGLDKTPIQVNIIEGTFHKFVLAFTDTEEAEEFVKIALDDDTLTRT